MRPGTPRSWTGLSFTAWTILILLTLPSTAERVGYRFYAQDRMAQQLRDAPKKNADRKEALERLFRESGCANPSEQPVRASKLGNVVCTIPGETGRTIVVGAHYDHTPEGDGVADNWSGSVTLAALYYTVSAAPRRHTFVFVGFTDEEKGLIGSKSYANALSKDEVAGTSAMVNMDSLGLSDTEIWLSRSDKRLSTLLVQAADALSVPISGVDVEKVGTTDSESFAQRHIPVITVHSVTQATLPVLHSKRDRFEAIDVAAYHRTYRLMAAYLVLLDQKLDAENSPQRLQQRALDRIVPLQATLDHVQGIDVEGGTLWVSSVERKSHRGFLHRFDLETGKLLAEVEVQDGDRYHPGGITLDGDSIWVPVAEYRRLSTTVMQRRDKRTLELLSSFPVADHIGSVAAAPDVLYGGNWDSLQIYTWTREGRQLAKRDNLEGTAYQDMKFVDGKIAGGGVRTKDEGSVDWLDPAALTLTRRILFGRTERGPLYTQEGMTLRGGLLYLLPEDGPSRLFVYRLPP